MQDLVRRRWSIELPIRTVGDYLKRFGFTPQKPLKRAYEQNPKAVQRWLDEEYPAIAKRAKEEGAEIHWGDETGLRNDSQHGRSYAPRGKTPEISLSAKRQRINLISSITNQGKVRFMTYEEKMHADILIRFMARLVKDADQKIFLVLDNLRVQSAAVQDQITAKSDRAKAVMAAWPDLRFQSRPDRSNVSSTCRPTRARWSRRRLGGSAGAVVIGPEELPLSGGFRLLPVPQFGPIAPFPVAARQTGRADRPHPAFTCVVKLSRSAGQHDVVADKRGRVPCRDTHLDIGDIPCLAVSAAASTSVEAAVQHSHVSNHRSGEPALG